MWKNRYQQINDFERLLAESGTLILKFFLYISKDEQKKRLLAREQDSDQAWKLSAGDWRERELWDAYQRAYEDALGNCSTRWAPWHIIPANNKWFRNLAIADTLARALRPYRKQWERSLSRLAEKKLQELVAFKAEKEKAR